MSLSALIAVALLGAGLYYLCPPKARWALLLAVSYAFYAYCGLYALPYLLATTASTWAGALLLANLDARLSARLSAGPLAREDKRRLREAAKRKKRALLWGVLALNLGLLCLVKYAAPALPRLSLLMPLGISFYTFQSIAYLLDVYNGKLAPQRNPLRYALFVSFFPQLIQGPIARYDQLAHQLYEPHRFDFAAVERGAMLMIWGLFKKKVIADRALPLVEGVFSQPGAHGGAVIAVGVLFYSLQQYADFSGGIDLAAGIAELFGIRLAPNFKRPYFSVSLGDFWRRWHISLGSFMRDYVFYPFALCRPVARAAKALKARFGPAVSRAFPAAAGNVLVFLLVGVWHGATANYVLWGLYNGVILAVSAYLEPVYRHFGENHARLVASRGFHALRVLRTFLIVNIGWYFDRSARASQALTLLWRTVARPHLGEIAGGALLGFGLDGRDFFLLAVATGLLFAVSLLQERGVAVREAVMARPLPVRWALLLAFALLLLSGVVTGGGYESGFLYAVF